MLSKKTEVPSICPEVLTDRLDSSSVSSPCSSNPFIYVVLSCDLDLCDVELFSRRLRGMVRWGDCRLLEGTALTSLTTRASSPGWSQVVSPCLVLHTERVRIIAFRDLVPSRGSERSRPLRGEYFSMASSWYPGFVESCFLFRVASVPNLSTFHVGGDRYRGSTLYKYRKNYDTVSTLEFRVQIRFH